MDRRDGILEVRAAESPALAHRISVAARGFLSSIVMAPLDDNYFLGRFNYDLQRLRHVSAQAPSLAQRPIETIEVII